MRLFDPKSCPNRAQKEGPFGGPDVTVATIEVAQSHRSELNRRPLLSTKVEFSGISRCFKGIRARFSLFLGTKSEKSAPETVPKACLERTRFAHPHTNLPRDPFKYGARDLTFQQRQQAELQAAVRRDLDRLVYGEGL